MASSSSHRPRPLRRGEGRRSVLQDIQRSRSDSHGSGGGPAGG
ncbi:unnamed protein product [Spirodela intermedia]|uniref:Uncharacterized protein n=1 Tax=Spirodela intermedia TaxID=51605 RepID=A0ABN7EBR6_SPIIN|nr:unnamed protein product [Spirodela intermedia]